VPAITSNAAVNVESCFILAICEPPWCLAALGNAAKEKRFRRPPAALWSFSGQQAPADEMEREVLSVWANADDEVILPASRCSTAARGPWPVAPHHSRSVLPDDLARVLVAAQVLPRPDRRGCRLLTPASSLNPREPSLSVKDCLAGALGAAAVLYVIT
jgi:hypothetical protein